MDAHKEVRYETPWFAVNYGDYTYQEGKTNININVDMGNINLDQ